MKVVTKSPNGLPVQGKWDRKRFFEIGPDGKLTDTEIPEDQIRHFQIKDNGAEEEVEPFDRTDVIETVDLIPREQVEDYLPHSYYELFADEPSSLYRISEFLEKNKLAMLSQFAFRGFTAYTALIYPIQAM